LYRLLITISLILTLHQNLNAQSLVYSFTDPCTKAVTVFTIPLTGTTTILFLNRTASFSAQDVSNGTFGTWIANVYAEYKKNSPCSVQSGQVTQNQVTSNVVGSVVSSAASSATASVASSATAAASSAAASSTPSASTSSSSSQSSSSSETKAESTSTESSSSESSSSDEGGGDSEESDSGGGKGKGGKSGKAANANPMIVASDFTTAQNLDKSFTPILNIGISQSSLTGQTSWGLTSMTWMNFKQFALSGRYTAMKFKGGTLKFIDTYSATIVSSYGNLISFAGYSRIMLLGKYGVAGFAANFALSNIKIDKSIFLAPSLTAFYTRPFQVSTRLSVSPELYLMANPIMYSTKDRVTSVDRSVGFFGGSGFDYQLSRRFKINFNYKVNASTKKDFPVLSFFLIGSKVNL
jgi:hypothetical protein